jgi:hypothetical protein
MNKVGESLPAPTMTRSKDSIAVEHDIGCEISLSEITIAREQQPRRAQVYDLVARQSSTFM